MRRRSSRRAAPWPAPARGGPPCAAAGAPGAAHQPDEADRAGRDHRERGQHRRGAEHRLAPAAPCRARPTARAARPPPARSASARPKRREHAGQHRRHQRRPGLVRVREVARQPEHHASQLVPGGDGEQQGHHGTAGRGDHHARQQQPVGAGPRGPAGRPAPIAASARARQRGALQAERAGPGAIASSAPMAAPPETPST